MYDELIRLLQHKGYLGSVDPLLQWDQFVTMPPGALEFHVKQVAAIQYQCHRLETDPRIGQILAEIDRDGLDEVQLVNLCEIETLYDRMIRVPDSLVSERAELRVKSHEAWVVAKDENNFKKFLPFLERSIEIAREVALCIDKTSDPYETLLHEYEPNISLSELNILFTEIKKVVVPLVESICTESNQLKFLYDTYLLHREIPESLQMVFCRRLADIIGYDFEKGRLDTSVHPFTLAYGRITTRFSDGWWGAVASTIHEVGHAKYEHGLPLEHFGTPLGTARSMGIHESLSRLWENHVGKSHEFWKGQYDVLQNTYASALRYVNVDEFCTLINTVKPGYIRVNADELTYSMHILLRLEIEQALINDTLAARDLPEAWNIGMEKSLGVTPPTDTLGCLQDIHWAQGCFGYFPTYLFGSMISAQLWNAAEKKIDDLLLKIEKGDFFELDTWLFENIYIHGCRFSTKELIARACGEEPCSKYYTRYLHEKFSTLYDL